MPLDSPEFTFLLYDEKDTFVSSVCPHAHRGHRASAAAPARQQPAARTRKFVDVLYVLLVASAIACVVKFVVTVVSDVDDVCVSSDLVSLLCTVTLYGFSPCTTRDVRSVSPWPGASATRRQRRLQLPAVWHARTYPRSGSPPASWCSRGRSAA